MKPIRYFLFILLIAAGSTGIAQTADTLYPEAGAPVTEQPVDSADIRQADSAASVQTPVTPPRENLLKKALEDNRFIAADKTPEYFLIDIKTWKNGKEIFFYAMCALLLILGVFKTFFNHYFSTLFSVYFNTSLRQTQLSEQLLQARLPSFILNIFFILIAGIFSWLVFLNVYQQQPDSPYLLLQICVAAIAMIYIVKFCFLKFIGWLSDMQEVTDQYIFIIFLVNKLLAVVLVPFVILIAFGKSDWINIYITLALLTIGVLFFSRYIKSYGLLRQKFPMSPFHFILFFVGTEMIPLLLIYKVAVDYVIVS